jgi:hypothetical protein
MFQSKMREVIIQTIHDDVHEVDTLLQLRNPILPLPLHGIQQKDGSRVISLNPRPRKPGVVVPSLFPELGGGIVSGEEVHGNSVVVSNVGRGVIEMLLHIVGSIRLKGWGEGGGGSVEHGVVGNEGRHSSDKCFRGERWWW